MKKLITFLFLLQCTLFAKASTNVPAGNVSGATWTLAGSPYLVGGNITISSLNIQPGVEVIMQGFYQIKVNGILRAVGTQAAPIVFKIHDTTGWHNDIIQSGGWRGVYFNEYNGVDSSLLSYCIFKDVKHGVNFPMNDNAALFIFFRSLKVSHCEYVHCQSTANQSVGNILVGSLKPGQVFELEYCNIHANQTRVAAFKFDTYLGGSLKVHDNRFHHNMQGGTVFTIYSEMLFENNEVDSNSNGAVGMGTIRVDGGHNMLRGNKIHHNVNQRLAAIACTMGKTTIEKNLICNNQMLDGNCGLTDGGGAIHISHNNNGTFDSTEYIIRDNVIANNYANYFGAGIYIYSCKAWIYNNHFIKNKSTSDGAAIHSFNNLTQLYIQNNIFYGNESSFYGVKKDIRISEGVFYTFENNWIDYPFYEMIEATNIVRNGDTTSNVIAASPLLVNPTLVCGHTDNALFADFKLTQTSACINAGKTQNISPSATDFYGNQRISGPKIDIGAHEYFSAGTEGINDLVQAFPITVYPNPAKDKLKMDFEKFDTYTINLYNLTGTIVCSKFFVGKSEVLNISALPAGNYILTAENKASEKVIRKISIY
ncbi:MAG: T9SS type A sorting domain-containing protein [Bacteroidetes bacterium]|nr:T9SS type A sorting domain-containing protein [Bacteroidota bacterium]